jgi:hypothetical protein
MRVFKLVLAAALLGLSLTLVGPSPAQAHATCTPVPAGGGYGCVNSSHNLVSACDTATGSYGVRTYYWTSTGAEDSVGDSNGSSGGCGTESPSSGTVVGYRVCAGPNGQDYSCTQNLLA